MNMTHLKTLIVLGLISLGVVSLSVPPALAQAGVTAEALVECND